ncbi:MAG TPA: fluoride efflux transporter CrcB [Gammaproteobacteria bacterium]|nr:fluoride efflux transporter CrcB [Gammaproteobacteria bacterium]
MWNYVAVALGGVVGCCARYGVSQWVQVYYSRSFPLSTLIINVLGCFVMGFLFFATIERVSISPTLRMALLTGVLGGFTTFSTFAMEALLLLEDGETGYAVLYLALSVFLGLAAAFLGVYLARSL